MYVTGHVHQTLDNNEVARYDYAWYMKGTKINTLIDGYQYHCQLYHSDVLFLDPRPTRVVDVGVVPWVVLV